MERTTCRECHRLSTALDEYKRQVAEAQVELAKLRAQLNATKSPDQQYTTSEFLNDDTIPIYRMLVVKTRSQLKGVQAQLGAEREESDKLRAEIHRLEKKLRPIPNDESVEVSTDRCWSQLASLELQIDGLKSLI